MRIVAGMIAFLALAGTAEAQESEAPDVGVDEPYRQCIDDSRTTAEARACGDALLARIDARLNEQWRQLTDGYFDGVPRQRLVEEQRAWIRYRDSACRFYLLDAFGSQGASGDFPLCLARVIQHRIDELEAIRRNLDDTSAS